MHFVKVPPPHILGGKNTPKIRLKTKELVETQIYMKDNLLARYYHNC